MSFVVCVVCGQPEASSVLCPRCERSYDRAKARDSTILGMIEWAAKRARRYALAIPTDAERFAAASKRVRSSLSRKVDQT